MLILQALVAFTHFFLVALLWEGAERGRAFGWGEMLKGRALKGAGAERGGWVRGGGLVLGEALLAVLLTLLTS
jgi:hypothetical protein